MPLSDTLVGVYRISQRLRKCRMHRVIRRVPREVEYQSVHAKLLLVDAKRALGAGVLELVLSISCPAGSEER